jgi:hypothetical protein
MVRRSPSLLLSPGLLPFVPALPAWKVACQSRRLPHATRTTAHARGTRLLGVQASRAGSIPPAECLALSRLRHPLVQRRQALRRLPDRTDRRRRDGWQNKYKIRPPATVSEGAVVSSRSAACADGRTSVLPRTRRRGTRRAMPVVRRADKGACSASTVA